MTILLLLSLMDTSREQPPAGQISDKPAESGSWHNNQLTSSALNEKINAAGRFNDAPDSNAHILKGGSDYKGEILFVEHFNDSSFTARGWYDVDRDIVITSENSAPGTTSMLECQFVQGSSGCSVPRRKEFPGSEAIYLSYWVQYSSNWVGSGRGYHPHEFHLVTNLDDSWVGLANSHLTFYVEQNDLKPFLAVQDSKNVDNNCILRNDDTFVGCNGNIDTYPFTESRSVASCNGLHGFTNGRDCYWTGSYWYSSRRWVSPERAFTRGNWHFVEAFVKMNDIIEGKGIPDGSIRYWVDGELYVASDNILLRTGKNPGMSFNQFIFAPYIGGGSPTDQYMRMSGLTIARGVMP